MRFFKYFIYFIIFYRELVGVVVNVESPKMVGEKKLKLSKKMNRTVQCLIWNDVIHQYTVRLKNDEVNNY